jgi:hypothetical protein
LRSSGSVGGSAGNRRAYLEGIQTDRGGGRVWPLSLLPLIPPVRILVLKECTQHNNTLRDSVTEPRHRGHGVNQPVWLCELSTRALCHYLRESCSDACIFSNRSGNQNLRHREHGGSREVTEADNASVISARVSVRSVSPACYFGCGGAALGLLWLSSVWKNLICSPHVCPFKGSSRPARRSGVLFVWFTQHVMQ